jgi:hypothetical protein
MPGNLYDDLAAVARARGVDLADVMNWILAEFHPQLMKEQAAHQRAMLEAAASREWEKMGPAEALRAMRDLLGTLQEEYAALSKKMLARAG